MANGLEATAIRVLSGLMSGAADIYKRQLAFEIKQQSGLDGDHKLSGWADDIADSMYLKQIRTSNTEITGVLAIPHGNNEARAMVLMHGNPGIGNPPMTKPGQETWDDNMQEQSVHVPAQEAARRMPQKYLHESGWIDPNFLQNTGKKTQDQILNHFISGAFPIKEQLNRLIKSMAGK